MQQQQLPRNSKGSRNHSRKFCSVILLVSVLVVAALCSTGGGGMVSASYSQPDNSPSASSFRCYRPFSALSSFTPNAMHSTDNCNLGFVKVKNASASTSCHAEGCSVTIKMEESERLEVTKDDQARYTLELRAVNDTTIAYKGFDGRGYSMCCMFLETPSAECEWVDVTPEEKEAAAVAVTTIGTKKQVVTKCPLQDRIEGEEPVSGLTLQGSISKPLHSYKAGVWEATLAFFDYKSVEPVGRIKIQFTVTEEELSKYLEGGVKKDEEPVEEIGVVSGGNTAAAAVTDDMGSAVVSVRKTEDDSEKKEL